MVYTFTLPIKMVIWGGLFMLYSWYIIVLPCFTHMIYKSSVPKMWLHHLAQATWDRPVHLLSSTGSRLWVLVLYGAAFELAPSVFRDFMKFLSDLS